MAHYGFDRYFTHRLRFARWLFVLKRRIRFESAIPCCAIALWILLPGNLQAETPIVEPIQNELQRIKTNLDLMWVLVAAAIVFIMQAGFMCLEAGLATAKNSINVAIKNLADFVLATTLFWAFGFGLMFGQTNGGWIGGSHFLIDLKDHWVVVFFVFQAVFVGTAATIDSGALAGRTRFSAYLIMSALISGLIYPIFGHWVWGGGLNGEQAGWLQRLGFIDFAGSTVVHSVGGWMALAGCIVVGPRIGRYGKDGKTNHIPPHNMTMAYLGTFILIFGWFGFNCGSTLEANSSIAPIAMNTILAACFGCLASSALSWTLSPYNRPKGEMIANGILGGLVGITAGCAYVEATGAMWIGLGSGVLVIVGEKLLTDVLKIDDVVGAIPVHGICGAWGTVAVGLFITPEHLVETTRWHQLYVQAVGVGACFVWTFGVGYLLLRLIDTLGPGLRVSAEDERLGLNIAEHGASSGVLELVNSMHRATVNNDFSEAVKVEEEIGTEMGDLARGFNRMVDAIRNAFAETERRIEQAKKAQSDAEVAEADLERSRRESEAYIRKIAQNLQHMMTETQEAMEVISRGTENVQEKVNWLQEHSQMIDGVLKQIDKIAFSTKLLSLNAIIEAAHAGDTGTSFAVVAEEMTQVADQTRKASETISDFTKRIHELLGSVAESVGRQSTSVHDGNDRIRKAGGMLKELLEVNLKTA